MNDKIGDISSATRAYSRASKYMSRASSLSENRIPSDTITIGQKDISTTTLDNNHLGKTEKVASSAISEKPRTRFNRVLKADNTISALEPRQKLGGKSGSGFSEFRNILEKSIERIKGANNISSKSKSNESIIKIAGSINEAAMYMKLATSSSKKFTEAWKEIMSIPL